MFAEIGEEARDRGATFLVGDEDFKMITHQLKKLKEEAEQGSYDAEEAV